MTNVLSSPPSNDVRLLSTEYLQIMGDNAARHSRPRSAPSSPLWKKRPSTSPFSMPFGHGNKVAFPRTPSYLYDKALPPLPDAARSASPRSRQLPTTPSSLESPTLIANSAPKATAPSAPASARTTLHLTPAIPTTFLLEANTVAHDTRSHGFASPMLRKAKSSQKLETDTTSEHTSKTDTLKTGGRVRNFSFGSSNLLSFAGDLMTKGKEKDVDASKASSKPLLRKGSFWSRKRHIEHSPEAQVPSVVPHDTSIMSSEKQTHIHVRGLSRSLSERSFLSRSSPPVMENTTSFDFDSSPSPRDCPSSVKVPQSPYWSGFLHPAPRVRNSKDLSDLRRSDKPHTTLRPRAQTNPPLLHRLSLNIFSFAASPPSPNLQDLSAVDLTVAPSVGKTRTNIPKFAGDGEIPAAYVQRLISSVNKAEVAGILASR